REPMYGLIRRLSHEGIQVNVTAMMTLEQVREVGKALHGGAASNVSVFAGRVADTGRDPVPMMREAVEILRAHLRRPIREARFRHCRGESRAFPPLAAHRAHRGPGPAKFRRAGPLHPAAARTRRTSLHDLEVPY